jgi:hypothetical protein
MFRLVLPFLGIAVAFVVPAQAQASQPAKDPSGDQTSPALLEMIRKHLAGTSGLRSADGVSIEESKFFRGSVRIRGRVVSESQRDALRRALESIRSRLEMEVDVKISSFDLSGLRVVPLPPTAQTPKEAPKTKDKEAPKSKAPETCDGEVVEIVEEYPSFVVPFSYYMPPPPQQGRKHCFSFFRRCDDRPTGYGYPSPGAGYWWYGAPPMPYGYSGFYYPH